MFLFLRRAGVVLAFTLTALTGCLDEDKVAGPAAQLPPQASVGEVFTVTNVNDSGAGTLRQAIADAGAGGTIQFDPSLGGQTIAVHTPLRITNTTMIIEGPAAGGISLAGMSTRVLTIGDSFPPSATDVTLRNVTIKNGSSDFGAGIFVRGKLLIENSTIRDNAASNAISSGLGGGIYSEGDLTIVNSTVSGNSAGFVGGGVVSLGFARLRLTNVTVANNSAGTSAGGLHLGGSSVVTIENSIVANNSAPTSANCDVSANPGVIYYGTNLMSDASCGPAPEIAIVDPQLTPLADNGGPTQTHALLRTSPALNATACLVNADQRYVSRPQGPQCDIGAFEFDDYTTINVVLDGSPTVSPKTGIAVATGSVTCSTTESIELLLTLKQNQKAGRAPVVVQASAALPMTCDSAPNHWSAVLVPATGGFQNGAASASLITPNTPVWVTPVNSNTAVKLFWSHK